MRFTVIVVRVIIMGYLQFQTCRSQVAGLLAAEALLYSMVLD